VGRTESVPEVVERHLVQLIDSGRLIAGQRLDAERTIAADLGVSRAAVRDALARMESAGLVERRQGSGTRVVERLPSSAELAARLREHAAERAHSAELRRVLEPEIARLAAARAEPHHLDRLDELVAAAVASTETEDSVRLDVAFHVAVAAAAGNPLLLTMSELATSWTAGPRLYSHLDDRGRRASVDGHRRIADAIRSGDAATAATAMREHLGEIERVIDENSGAATPSPLSPAAARTRG